ncbi:cytidyltransferase [Clostridium sp. D2Q-11]|uniref:nicotinate-nucleotide adenylyltransferase n=1 Tax=Anaeromonas frigoriresistens TaxID=2683708 RepID=A0A942UVL1_9FIRM|nr:cytidyltransferase [Anaeromonas frigoriresistens]MBS4537241.1 cytidyltransferase [Anaeromonas frigoriresistens]
MSKSALPNLYTRISNKILNIEDLKDQLIYNDIKSYLRNDIFPQKLRSMIKNKDFSTKATFDLISPIIQIFDNKEEKEWLSYFYNFVLNKSFPEALEITLIKENELPSKIFITTFRIITDYERSNVSRLPHSRYPMEFVTDSEEKKIRITSEYKKFKKAFRKDFVYELMKLHQDITGHTTLNHITGVHNLAMHISKQLHKLNLPVDLGRVSGAAAGHDIGKFGCKGEELKRVPYLHYYYTDQWFKNHKLEHIGHIATNHSTWDLELENLPIESLILIYSDFRVKNRYYDGKKEMHIFTLKDSFEVILNKLDNVDEQKEKRYKKVYSKLKDFENYMLNLGISVELTIPGPNPIEKKYYPLMKKDTIVENLKYRAIEHNIYLMNRLRSEASLSAILEIARSENDWKKLRGYLNIFEEYSTYLTQKQKIITLNFLYELLIHKEEDIRKQSSELIGTLIAMYDEEYRKEVPKNVKQEESEVSSYELLDKYIQLILYPDHKILEAHKKWIGLSLRTVMSSILSYCHESQRENFRNVLLKYYSFALYENKDVQFYLLQTVKYIPFEKGNEKPLSKMFDFILLMLHSDNSQIRVSALERVYNLLFRIREHSDFTDKLIQMMNDNIVYSEIPAENFLKLKIAKKLNLSQEVVSYYQKNYDKDFDKTPEIFLKNLKSATNWIIKKVHIELLLDHVIQNNDKNVIHTAMHFTNLIKVSAVENVRNHAGEALLKVFPFLSLEQRNDVTIELLRALEIQGYHFTKYIPNYLGQLMLYLHPIELDELIDDFIEKIKSSNRQIQFLILKTVGVTIQNYSNYNNIFIEDKDVYNDRLTKLLGVLLNGLVSYDMQVKQESFRIIGSGIFGSKTLTLKEKQNIFALIGKKILTLLSSKDEGELWFLNNSASLNNIYRFISDYKFLQGDIEITKTNKIAFFPGTFDPFSLSHKEIAREIRDLGFEVYLQVDEFSWSKRTQPHKIRREIINMSISDELDIYLYPEDLSVNISNSEDLKNLKDYFSDSEVYIVVGSDVLLNASSYKTNKTKDSIHSFSHIVFERGENNQSQLDSVLEKIAGNIVRLSLPAQFEDISSTQIREYIDDNRDISELIDPLAQTYIYETGVYRREPQYKTLIQTQSISIDIIDNIEDELLYKLSTSILKEHDNAFKALKNIKSKLNPRVILLKDVENKNKIIGFSIFHWVRSSNLFNQFNDNNVSEYIRENSVGRIICVDGIFIDNNTRFKNLEQILLTETLAFCLAKDYTYGIFKNIIDSYPTKSIYETLVLQGFMKLPFSDDVKPIYVVSMTNPCTLNLDLESIIKEPFKSNRNVQKAIERSRKRLQRSLSSLYPGQLILSFDRDILYEKMIEKICEINDMPTKQLTPKVTGEKMCVPFGSVLNGHIVPNTVTKSMHTEKMYTPDIEDFSIEPFPYYMSLENQIKMLYSFNRPVILVDDLLNKGYRIKAIDPLLKKENIEVSKIIVGILSGRGKELMDIQNREVDSAYFIPNLRVWFNESALYPFIGGDTVWRGYIPERNLLPSVNFVLPYTSPIFIKGTHNRSLYELSRTSIYNSIDILSTLEREYQNKHERNLTLKHLSEVFISPRCPDKGNNMEYDINLKASRYLKNDLEQLKRIEDIIKR